MEQIAEIMENEEKIFENYLNLPKNVRTRVIDKMVPVDRFRSIRCSKLFREEAESSKNFVYKLSLYCRDNNTTIRVELNEDGLNRIGFFLHFVEQFGRKYKLYSRINGLTMASVELHSSADLVQCAIEELKHRLQTYHGSIKELEILDVASRLTNVDFGIECVTNLETLIITNTVNNPLLFSKIQKPLKKLCIKRKHLTPMSINYEQVQVQDIITWPYAHFDLEQLQRLSATKVAIRIGRLTERDMFKFIRSWQDGSIGRTIESYKFYLHKTNFDKTKLLRLLRIDNHEQQNNLVENYEIKHHDQAGKQATLLLARNFLEFSTISSIFDIFDIMFVTGGESDFRF